MSDETKPAVFFDGSCPLCRREIGFYQRQPGADALEWIDVSAYPGAEVAPGLTKEAAMARFHVRSADGAVVSGAAAFASLWQTLPRLRFAGRIAALPVIRTVLEGTYALSLPLRPHLQRFVRRLGLK